MTINILKLFVLFSIFLLAFKAYISSIVIRNHNTLLKLLSLFLMVFIFYNIYSLIGFLFTFKTSLLYILNHIFTLFCQVITYIFISKIIIINKYFVIYKSNIYFNAKIKIIDNKINIKTKTKSIQINLNELNEESLVKVKYL